MREAWGQSGKRSEGRAYLLRRKLADAQIAARERCASALAQAVYEQLLRHAHQGQLDHSSAVPEQVTYAGSSHEVILRASLLVPRTETAVLLATADRYAKDLAGLHCYTPSVSPTPVCMCWLVARGHRIASSGDHERAQRRLASDEGSRSENAGDMHDRRFR